MQIPLIMSLPIIITATTIPIVMMAGDAALWESRLLHGRGEPISSVPRYSISTTYQYHFLKETLGYRPVVNEDVFRALTQEERLLYDYGNIYGGFLPGNTAILKPAESQPPRYIPELHR